MALRRLSILQNLETERGLSFWNASFKEKKMTTQISFTKEEHKVIPNFRQQLNLAESTEDVKKFFFYTAKELLESILGKEADLVYEDVSLFLESPPYFVIGKRLSASGGFQDVWKDSDLSRVMRRLAETAVARYRRLEKNPEKSSSKIRM